MSWGVTWLTTLIGAVGLPSSVLAGFGLNPTFLVASLGCICLLLFAPFRLWRGANLRADAVEARLATLEAKLTPCFSVECKTERNRVPGSRESEAMLLIHNMGLEQIRNAYAKVARVIEHSYITVNDDRKPYSRELYENEDIFLGWQSSAERYHDFHTSAILNVALARRGDGTYALRTVGKSLFPGLHPFDRYELTVEIAADNVPALTKKFALRIHTESSTYENHDGKKVIMIDVPYDVEFEEIQLENSFP